MTMVGADKVIITCAITGAIHTPTMSPYLPITPDQIAAEAIAAAEAGAAILHCTRATRKTASLINRRKHSRVSYFALSKARVRQST
jgi:uncharacterized protein (DUF849 family)